MDILILEVRYVISIDPYHNIKNWIFDDICVPVLNTKQAKEKKQIGIPPHKSHLSAQSAERPPQLPPSPGAQGASCSLNHRSPRISLSGGIP